MGPGSSSGPRTWVSVTWVWVDGRRVTQWTRSVVVFSSSPVVVELAPVDARPRHAVDVEVDGHDERQRQIERTDRREHRVAKVLTVITKFISIVILFQTSPILNDPSW